MRSWDAKTRWVPRRGQRKRSAKNFRFERALQRFSVSDFQATRFAHRQRSVKLAGAAKASLVTSLGRFCLVVLNPIDGKSLRGKKKKKKLLNDSEIRTGGWSPRISTKSILSPLKAVLDFTGTSKFEKSSGCVGLD